MSDDQQELELEHSSGPNGQQEVYETSDRLKDLVDMNFLEYASYVIRDRAIPHLEDGLKPVQRRILWSLHEKDDGKLIKVANIVGYCMQFHPHGDASIADALVNLANKGYLVEGQGNFGNIHTGDRAAASRYIECRLTELARTQLFNKDLTTVVPSYDGRNEEPVTLPAKLPLLLMQGAEGIAVGLSTKVLPHNFIELLEAQIAILKKKPFRVEPDFLQGGIMDCSDYDKGRGKVKVRAKIETKGESTLVIRDLPYGTTTETLTRSIEDAARKKKIKVRSIDDYTAEQVEIHINLVSGQKPEKVEQALYAFTDCEVSLSSNILVIRENRPVEMTVDEVLRYNTEQLVEILKGELLHERGRLQDAFHYKTLVQIFVENRIYRAIEECEAYKEVQQVVLEGVNKFRKLLRRDITPDDVEMLLAIRIKRISQFDIDKNRQDIEDLLAALDEVEKRLKKLIPYATKYLRNLVKTYRDRYPRRTKTGTFKEIEVRALTAKDLSIMYDAETGYVGHGVRKGELIMECSPLDKVLVVGSGGRYWCLSAPDKFYVGKGMMYCAKFDRDKPFLYVYTSGMVTYLKKFKFGGVIQSREYRLCPEGSKSMLFEDSNPPSLYLKFKPAKNQRVHQQVVDLSTYQVRGARTKGNQLTVKRVASIGTKPPRGWKDSNIDPDVELMDF
ncbi:MAG: DNA topoisomerase IV subunit A [Verrucomicrobiota bacterium]